jgi:hypothetical protein
MHHGIEIYQRPLRHDPRRRLHRVTEKAMQLPAFKGALFCRGFDHALRKTVCAVPPPTTCTAYKLRTQCVYTRLFATFITGAQLRFLRDLDPAPRPLIFGFLDSHFNFHAGVGIKNG